MRNTIGSEQLGKEYAKKLARSVCKRKGAYLCDEDGSYHVIVKGRRIPLNFRKDNWQLAEMMLDVCHVSTVSMASQVAIQRLQVLAARMASKAVLRRFSAFSEDRRRLYVPIVGGQLLCITAEGVSEVHNGSNPDSIWLEHPYDDPLKYSPTADVRAGLAQFKRLLVETQGCRIPEMRWFVAMHEALFPYLRDLCAARMLVVHIGSQQQGKTSGAQRFTLLHGLGEVLGDVTPASLANLGDIGLLVEDNKEHANFSQELIDFNLFLSTGAQRIRSTQDGRLRPVQHYRPAAVITTIEGVYKPELRARCANVYYELSGEKLGREEIEQEIRQNCHTISSSLIAVLQQFMACRTGRCLPGPAPGFAEHYTVLSELLHAYAKLARKPAGWADSQIAGWNHAFSEAREPEEDELEQPIRMALRHADAGDCDAFRVCPITHGGKPGRLYVTECAPLLGELQRRNGREYHFPKTAQGLSRRLASAQFQSFVYLKTDAADVPQLRRTATAKPIGFFVPDAGVTLP